jgi:hypothetical protein
LLDSLIDLECEIRHLNDDYDELFTLPPPRQQPRLVGVGFGPAFGLGPTDVATGSEMMFALLIDEPRLAVGISQTQAHALAEQLMQLLASIRLEADNRPN